MRITILLTLLFLSEFSFGQINRKEVAESKIYVRATYFDQKNEIIGLQLRTALKDTLIENRHFQKFITEDFVDYASIDKTDIYFESFSNGNYKLLNENLQTVHNISYTETEEQVATLFGKQVKTSLEYIETASNSSPKESLKITEQTPRKYFKTDNSEIYFIIIPELKTLTVSSNGQFYTKQLFGENYNDIYEGIKNNLQTSNRYDIQIGDEIQLFRRRKSYNDSTGLAEYQDFGFKNIKYKGDSIIDGNRSLRMEVEGYDYLTGYKYGPEELLTQVSDSGYHFSGIFIPFQEYSTKLKLWEKNEKKSFFLQGVSKDTINGFSYDKIVQVSEDYYRLYILPFFPMPYVEFVDDQLRITYSKIKGIENGLKRERTYIKYRNNIRDVYVLSDKKIELETYFIDNFDIEIEIRNLENDEIISLLKTKSKKGINSFTITTEKLEKENSYYVNINYRAHQIFGNIRRYFKTNKLIIGHTTRNIPPLAKNNGPYSRTLAVI